MQLPIFRQRTIQFALVVALLITSWLAAFAFMLWHMHDDALDNGLATASTHARGFEEHLTQTLQLINLTAGNVDPQSDAHTSQQELSNRLAIMLRPTPFIRSMSLMDAQGRIFASSNPANLEAGIDIGNFFPEVDSTSNILRIGYPWRGRDFVRAESATPSSPIEPDESSFIPVLRRLASNRDVWLLAAINPDYFINYWTQLLEPGAGHVQWLRYDDVLLSSSLAEDAPASLGQAGEVGRRLSSSEHGALTQPLPTGRNVITAYRASSQFPVVIAVHMDREHVLADWRLRANALTAILVPIILALALTGMALWRRRQRMAQQQQALARERRLVTSVFDSSTEATILTSPDGEIIAVNPAFERSTGFMRSEVVGKKPSLLKYGLNPRENIEELWDTISRGEPWRGELQNKKKTGEIYWASIIISTVLDENGKVVHYIATMEDISAKKRHVIELQMAKEAAEAANIAKSQFLTSMSHELRTPLNAILGYAQLFEMDPSLSQENHDNIKEVLHASHHLLSLINELLDMSRIDSGKLELQLAPTRVSGILGDCVSLVSTKSTEKGIALVDAGGNGHDAMLLVDPLRLRQVLLNLLSNAIKYNRRGGTVQVTSMQTNQLVRIAVKDTGPGIPADKQSRIFTAFDRLGAEAGNIEGTGIGLLITKRLTEAMGGIIGFESVEGQGSTFWVEFPWQEHSTTVMAAETA